MVKLPIDSSAQSLFRKSCARFVFDLSGICNLTAHLQLRAHMLKTNQVTCKDEVRMDERSSTEVVAPCPVMQPHVPWELAQPGVVAVPYPHVQFRWGNAAVRGEAYRIIIGG